MIILNEFDVFDGEIGIRNLSGNFPLLDVQNFYDGVPADSIAVSGELSNINLNSISWELYDLKTNQNIENNPSLVKTLRYQFVLTVNHLYCQQLLF